LRQADIPLPFLPTLGFESGKFKMFGKNVLKPVGTQISAILRKKTLSHLVSCEDEVDGNV
jgi:hypothetical protein|tara:strand:- start:234 stop:413 length:180 start_codon:yes stop_codon:yes gene_type:complete